MKIDLETQKNVIRHAMMSYSPEQGWRVDGKHGGIRLALLKDGSAIIVFPEDYDTSILEKTLGGWASEFISLLWRYFKFECGRILIKGLSQVLTSRLLASSNDKRLLQLV